MFEPAAEAGSPGLEDASGHDVGLHSAEEAFKGPVFSPPEAKGSSGQEPQKPLERPPIQKTSVESAPQSEPSLPTEIPKPEPDQTTQTEIPSPPAPETQNTDTPITQQPPVVLNERDVGEDLASSPLGDLGLKFEQERQKARRGISNSNSGRVEG